MSELDGAYNSFGRLHSNCSHFHFHYYYYHWLWRAETYSFSTIPRTSGHSIPCTTTATASAAAAMPNVVASSYIQHLISSMEPYALYLTHSVWWIPFKRDTLSRVSEHRPTTMATMASTSTTMPSKTTCNKKKSYIFRISTRALLQSMVTRKYEMLCANLYAPRSHTRSDQIELVHVQIIRNKNKNNFFLSFRFHCISVSPRQFTIKRQSENNTKIGQFRWQCMDNDMLYTHLELESVRKKKK